MFPCPHRHFDHVSAVELLLIHTDHSKGHTGRAEHPHFNFFAYLFFCIYGLCWFILSYFLRFTALGWGSWPVLTLISVLISLWSHFKGASALPLNIFLLQRFYFLGAFAPYKKTHFPTLFFFQAIKIGNRENGTIFENKGVKVEVPSIFSACRWFISDWLNVSVLIVAAGHLTWIILLTFNKKSIFICIQMFHCVIVMHFYPVVSVTDVLFPRRLAFLRVRL